MLNKVSAVSTRQSKQTPLARYANLLLGTDAKQRIRIQRALISMFVYAICILLIAYESYFGIMSKLPAQLLATACVLSVGGFYLALRSGWSLRFKDPALTLPQIFVAQLCIAGAYATTGYAHPGTLILFALVLVFGLFSLSARLALAVSSYSVLLVGAVMLIKSNTDPIVYPARIEFIYFVFVVTILPTIALLAGQLTRMRDRLKAQKKDLETALAHIESMATRDDLTGLFNRRHMLEAIGEQVRRQARSGHRFSLVLLDLDYFKHFNDTYGHTFGDQVLCVFSLNLLASLRETDIIGRWGGEEFLLLLPETPPGSSTLGISRLRDTLAKLPVLAEEPELRIQFSAGVIEVGVGEPIAQAIERADKALYAAKLAGRNRTIVA